MSRHIFVFSIVSSMLLACGAAHPPQSLGELKDLTKDDRVGLAREEAPGSWSEGTRYLAMAEQAVQEGDSKNADRLARLGIIQIKTALASAEQATARMRLEAALEKKRELAEEFERVQAGVSRLEAEKERERIRRHLENVVDATRRRAAAAEKVTEDLLSGKAQEALVDARAEVGQEMMARIRVWRDLLLALVEAGALAEKRTALVEGQIKLADERLSNADLAGVQQHIENAGIEARRLLEEVWAGKNKEQSQMLNQMSEQLSSKGFDIVEEEFSNAVRFIIPLSKRGRPPGNWTEPLISLGKALVDVERLDVIVLASAGSLDKPEESKKQSHRRAEAAVEALIKAGLPKKRIHLSECGAASPLTALKQGKERIAVLLVPLP